MRVMGIDIETTGLDREKDHIVELGYVIREVKGGVWAPKNLSQGSFFIWEDDFPDPMPPEIYAVHKISSTHLQKAGVDYTKVFGTLMDLLDKYSVECFIAHNGLAFDKPFLEAKDVYAKHWSDLPWVDTKAHVKYPVDCKNNNLLYLAAYHGFLNPFPHDALSDVQTMMRIIQHYDFEKLYARAKEPWVTLKADVKYDGRELARARGYQWNGEVKEWRKTVPQSEVAAEDTSQFRVIVSPPSVK